VQDLPRSNVLYGYRIDGPQDWGKGHRFDGSIVLVDPYAKLIEGRRYFGDISMKLSKFLGTYDFDSLPFDWGENYKLPNIAEVFACINDSCLKMIFIKMFSLNQGFIQIVLCIKLYAGFVFYLCFVCFYTDL
jgi:hypothetical protein